jgi:hypothetical protein
LAQDPISAYDRIDFSRLSVVVGQLGGDDGAEIARQLAILGIRNPKVNQEPAKIRRSIEVDNPDLLICNMTVAQDEAHQIVHGVRHQDIGTNPFVVTLSLAGPLAQADIVKTVDSGTDDLLIAPFSRDHFVMRVNELARNRKKFVATSSFIGPTRRTSTRPGRRSAEEFTVPNPIHATGTGMPRYELKKEIEAAATALNVRKLNSDIVLIGELVNEIVPDYENGTIGDDFKRRIGMLHDAIATIHRRAERLDFENLVSLCELSGNIVIEIKERPIPPNLRHLRALPKMVEGFQMALAAMAGGQSFN